MRTTRSAAALVACLALAAAPVLAACSQSTTSSGSGSSASAASSDSAASQSNEDAKGTAGTGSSDQSGTKEVTAPTAGITFSVPKSWESISDLNAAQKQEAAKAMGISAATLDQQIANLDIFYRATEPDETGFLSNVNVSKTLFPLSATPTEEEVGQVIAQQPGATSTGYSTAQTANGEAAIGTYTLSMAGKQTTGAVIITPTSNEGQYAILFVSSGTAEKVNELTTTITGTLH